MPLSLSDSSLFFFLLLLASLRGRFSKPRGRSLGLQVGRSGLSCKSPEHKMFREDDFSVWRGVEGKGAKGGGVGDYRPPGHCGNSVGLV